MPESGPIYEVVLRSIEADLRAGVLSIGDRLPSERTLAEKFGISRASVREAIRVLDALGVVRSRRGTGPASGAVISAEPGAALGWALRLHIATRALPVHDIVQARVQLESQIARESIASVPEAQLQRILAEARELMVEMDDESLSSADYQVLDAKLHLTLASISANVVFHTMLASLREATIGYVADLSAGRDWPATRDALQGEHRGIIAAMADRDAEGTATLLADHIVGFFEQGRS